MAKKRTIDHFFKRKEAVVSEQQPQQDIDDDMVDDVHDLPPELPNDNLVNESPRVEQEEIGVSDYLNSLIRDPGARPSILSFPSEQRDEIIRAYIKLGPYQIHKSKYPLSRTGPNGNMRSFQYAWFKRFWWLEYSEKNDAAYCFPCYLFNKKPIGKAGSETFTTHGFNKWKKVNSGKDCAFIHHEGKTPASAHNFSVRCYENLKNSLCHIENVIEKQTVEEIIQNRLRMKTSIETAKWLTLHACAFRVHDERPDSKDQGNFLELLKFIASYNKDVAVVVLGNAPQNAKYTSPDIQKEILRIFATNVQQSIRLKLGVQSSV